MEKQLRDLMIAEAGDPPHRVTVEAVRRRAIRRWAAQAGAASLAVILAVGLGVAVSAGILRFGTSAARGAGEHAGPPRYYVTQYFDTKARKLVMAVRARASGRVTAVVGDPMPGPGSSCGQGTAGLAAADDQTFFMTCSVWRQAPAPSRRPGLPRQFTAARKDHLHPVAHLPVPGHQRGPYHRLLPGQRQHAQRVGRQHRGHGRRLRGRRRSHRAPAIGPDGHQPGPRGNLRHQHQDRLKGPLAHRALRARRHPVRLCHGSFLHRRRARSCGAGTTLSPKWLPGLLQRPLQHAGAGLQPGGCGRLAARRPGAPAGLGAQTARHQPVRRIHQP